MVLDIMLPGTNGYDLCAELRRSGNWTPILMLTAKDGEHDEARALDTGADDFLAKPVSYVANTAEAGRFSMVLTLLRSASTERVRGRLNPR